MGLPQGPQRITAIRYRIEEPDPVAGPGLRTLRHCGSIGQGHANDSGKT